MEKVAVIGASGHIGTYLIPQLVAGGYEVVTITRGQSVPYTPSDAWEKVEQVFLDRTKEEKFAEKIAALHADYVIDLICFTLADAQEMVKALKQTNLKHYLYCSSIWAHGRAEILPLKPEAYKEALDIYGKEKYATELYLKAEFKENGFPTSIIMPGNISGPGWTIMNPVANKDYGIFQIIANGEKLYLPNFGMETLHHVHGYDVAQMFYLAVTNTENTLGESFHAVATEAMTLYGYAKAMYQFFGNEPNIDFLPWDKWCEYMKDKKEIDDTYHHIARSGYFSLENARQLLGYEPKYSTLETVIEGVESYIERGIITVDREDDIVICK